MKSLYVLVALVLIIVVIIILPIPLPEEETAPENQEFDMNLSESYPEHPKTIKDCERTSKRDFCVGDLAEMTNNLSLCHEIKDLEIRIFCVARISLNNTMCMDLGDEDLRGACLDSINLKRSWSSP